MLPKQPARPAHDGCPAWARHAAQPRSCAEKLRDGATLIPTAARVAIVVLYLLHRYHTSRTAIPDVLVKSGETPSLPVVPSRLDAASRCARA
jgi:hypothetical protein